MTGKLNNIILNNFEVLLNSLGNIIYLNEVANYMSK